MDDIKPIEESSDEMEDSPKDDDNSINAFQDKSEESSRSQRAQGNEISRPLPQNELEDQQLSSGISSRPSVCTSASTSQPINIGQFDQTATMRGGGKVYYSSRKFCIRTKCSRNVDAVISNRQHSILFLMLYREESDRNSTTFHTEILPSVGQDASQNQQSGLTAEIYNRRLFNLTSFSSQALDTNQLEDTLTNNNVFYSSGDLRIHTNCPQGIDAILSPRHNHRTTLPRLEHSDVKSFRIDQTARLPLKECSDTISASSQISPLRITRSLSKALNSPKTPSPSPEKQGIEKDARVPSAKRKRTETPEKVSEKTEINTESLRLKVSPSTAAGVCVQSPINLRPRETRSAARASEVFESVSRPLTPRKRKRECTESDPADSDTGNEMFISILNSLFHSANDDTKYSTKVKTHESEVPEQEFRKIAIEGITSISLGEASTNLEDLSPAKSFTDLSEKVCETKIQSNIFTDTSSGSPNKETGKRRKRSSPSNTWTIVPEEPGSLKLKLVPTDKVCSPNRELATSDIQKISSQASIPEDCQPTKKFKEFSLVSPEKTQSASNMADSAIDEQMLEFSPSRPIIENFDFSKETIDLETEMPGFTTSPSNREPSSSQLNLSCQLPEQSNPTNINIPRLALDFKTNKEKGENDNDTSDARNPMSEPNIDNFDSNPNLGVVQKSASRNIPEIKDPNVLTKENYSDPLQVSSSISSSASTSRQQTDVEMDPPYLDVQPGQHSTSNYQPVITDPSSAGDRLQTPSGTATGQEMGRATEPNTSTKKISKYVFNAQTLLLTVLEEIMELDEEHNLYRKFHNLFLGLTESSCPEREAVLTSELFLYQEQKKTAWYVRKLFTFPNVTSEYFIQESYENLVSQVVFALVSTVSEQTSLEFKKIMDSYNCLKCLYEKWSEFWSNDLEDIQDENSKIRVTNLKRMTQRLFLQTRNAYRELLMHIGEHAEEEIINSFLEKLWEEDKSFLRRLF